jgi:hypothetical protein
VNHTENTAKRPASSTGFLASLSNLFRDQGSGAPSRRRLAVGAAVLTLSLALAVGLASASKEVVDSIGANSSGTEGGQFTGPREVAANSSGVGPANVGDIYVTDDFNHRVQRFDEDGNFISAWGADIVQAGKTGDQAGTNPFEICTVAAECKAGVPSGGNGTPAGLYRYDIGADRLLDGPFSTACRGLRGPPKTTRASSSSRLPGPIAIR